MPLAGGEKIHRSALGGGSDCRGPMVVRRENTTVDKRVKSARRVYTAVRSWYTADSCIPLAGVDRVEMRQDGGGWWCLAIRGTNSRELGGMVHHAPLQCTTWFRTSCPLTSAIPALTRVSTGLVSELLPQLPLPPQSRIFSAGRRLPAGEATNQRPMIYATYRM